MFVAVLVLRWLRWCLGYSGCGGWPPGGGLLCMRGRPMETGENTPCMRSLATPHNIVTLTRLLASMMKGRRLLYVI